MKSLDFQTACAIYLCSNITIAVLLAVAFADSRARGARLWIAGLCVQIASVPFFALRGVIPDVLSIVVGNVLFGLSWTLYWASFDVFFGIRRPQWLYGLPLFLAVLIFTGWLHDVRPRAGFGSCLFAAQAWSIAATVLSRRGEFRPHIIITLALGYGLAGVSFLVRSAAVLVSPLPAPDPFAAGPAQSLAMLLSVPGMIACTMGFILLHRERTECEVRSLADTDHLTGLLNRRGFETLFGEMLRRGADNDAWTSLALLDIDHFKGVNDRHGHSVGDKALATLGRILTRELRDGDGVARLGGDEFCVLLSHTGPEQAAFVAERLRRAVAGHDWSVLGMDRPLTVTIGLASHQGRTGDTPDVVQLADMALIAAKNTARDTVLHADALGIPSRKAEV